MQNTTAATTALDTAANPFATVSWSVDGQAGTRLDTVNLWHSRRAGHDDLDGIRRILAIRYLSGLDAVDLVVFHMVVIDDADGMRVHPHAN